MYLQHIMHTGGYDLIATVTLLAATQVATCMYICSKTFVVINRFAVGSYNKIKSNTACKLSIISRKEILLTDIDMIVKKTIIQTLKCILNGS